MFTARGARSLRGVQTGRNQLSRELCIKTLKLHKLQQQIIREIRQVHSNQNNCYTENLYAILGYYSCLFTTLNNNDATQLQGLPRLQTGRIVHSKHFLRKKSFTQERKNTFE